MKSVEAYENTLKNSTDKDTMTLKRIILIDTNYDERNNIVDEDEILSVETLNLQARNNTTRNLCALITNYRIADIVASIEKHEVVIEVPCHKKEHVIGAILHKVRDFYFFYLLILNKHNKFLSNGTKWKIGLAP